MESGALDRLEAAADRALYRVAPEFARSLGYIPPTERIEECAYCGVRLRTEEMAEHRFTSHECAIAAAEGGFQRTNGGVLSSRHRPRIGPNAVGHPGEGQRIPGVFERVLSSVGAAGGGLFGL